MSSVISSPHWRRGRPMSCSRECPVTCTKRGVDVFVMPGADIENGRRRAGSHRRPWRAFPPKVRSALCASVRSDISRRSAAFNRRISSTSIARLLAQPLDLREPPRRPRGSPSTLRVMGVGRAEALPRYRKAFFKMTRPSVCPSRATILVPRVIRVGGANDDLDRRIDRPDARAIVSTPSQPGGHADVDESHRDTGRFSPRARPDGLWRAPPAPGKPSRRRKKTGRFALRRGRGSEGPRP